MKINIQIKIAMARVINVITTMPIMMVMMMMMKVMLTMRIMMINDHNENNDPSMKHVLFSYFSSHFGLRLEDRIVAFYCLGSLRRRLAASLTLR